MSHRPPYRSRGLSLYSTPPPPERLIPSYLSATSSGRSSPWAGGRINPRKDGSSGLVGLSGLSSPSGTEFQEMESPRGIEIQEMESLESWSSGRSTPCSREIRCPRETDQNGADDISQRQPYRSRDLSSYSTPPPPERLIPSYLSATSSSRSSPAQGETHPRDDRSSGLVDVSGMSGRSSPCGTEIKEMESPGGVEIQEVESPGGIEIQEVESLESPRGITYELKDCNFCHCGVKFLVAKSSPAEAKSPAKPASRLSTPPQKPSIFKLFEDIDEHYANSYSKF